jgi:hypothetical protein
MLFKKVIVVCSEHRAKHITVLCGQSAQTVSLKAGGMLRIGVTVLKVLRTRSNILV